MFKIEKDVPQPRSRSKYPFSEMEIGDSFFSEYKKAAIAAYGHARKHNMKFLTKKEDSGFRIWRVE